MPIQPEISRRSSTHHQKYHLTKLSYMSVYSRASKIPAFTLSGLKPCCAVSHSLHADAFEFLFVSHSSPVRLRLGQPPAGVFTPFPQPPGWGASPLTRPGFPEVFSTPRSGGKTSRGYGGNFSRQSSANLPPILRQSSAKFPSHFSTFPGHHPVNKSAVS